MRRAARIRGRAVVPNPDHLLTPGFFGTVRVPGSEPQRGVLVPDEAIATDQDRRLVWVVNADNSVTLARGAAGAAHRWLPPDPHRPRRRARPS